jgi:hypothetical protein
VFDELVAFIVLVENAVVAVTNPESFIFLYIVNVIRAVLRKHSPIAEKTRVGRLQVRTSCVADSLRVGIQIV